MFGQIAIPPIGPAGLGRQPALCDQLNVELGNEDVTIFNEMHQTRVIDPGRDYHELLRMLSEAIARGNVEPVPVMRPRRPAPSRTWYREKETGDINSLDPLFSGSSG